MIPVFERVRHDPRRLLRFGAAALVAIAVLVLVLRAIRPTELRETLAEVSPGLAILAAVPAAAFVVARAWRYRLLIGARPHQGRTILAITLGSWGASLILPGPTGDAAFVWLARSRLGTPVAIAAGAALLSRLLDVASLVVIALVTAPLAGVKLPGFVLAGGSAVSVLMAASLVALFNRRSRRALLTLLTALPVPTVIRRPLHAAIDQLGADHQAPALLLVTLLARLATSLQYFLLFAALDQPLSMVQVWFALSVRTLLLAVPVQGIGGLGTTQVWWTVGLTLLGWPADVALATSLAVHLLDLCVSLPQAVAGWVMLAIRRDAAPAETSPVEAAAQRR
jgi:uncharacterized membrane protein YbhN (UPF0104 family)